MLRHLARRCGTETIGFLFCALFTDFASLYCVNFGHLSNVDALHILREPDISRVARGKLKACHGHVYLVQADKASTKCLLSSDGIVWKHDGKHSLEVQEDCI